MNNNLPIYVNYIKDGNSVISYETFIQKIEDDYTDIQKVVSEFYGLTVSDLKSTRRERRIARPRQLAMYLAKQLTTLSLPDIALHFGRDHTTIMHAVKQIDYLLQTDNQLGKDAQTLTKRLKEGDYE